MHDKPSKDDPRGGAGGGGGGAAPAAAAQGATASLARTPLFDLHVALGAKMVPFAGYEMPVHYPAGTLAEHRHTREKAGLFDVSHMGLAVLKTSEAAPGTPEAHKAVAAAIETLVPGEIARLAPGRMRYTVFLSADGGILDDLMITRPCEPDAAGSLFLVVNAAVKARDFAHVEAQLAGRAHLEIADDRALLALQGPQAAAVLSRLVPEAADMAFMSSLGTQIDAIPVTISRCGYTGEDGFELCMPSNQATAIAERLLGEAEVAPIGLGARDTLRLEAGLCLYGHDIDETTSPIEADLAWTVAKRRREAGDFPGAERILRELREGPARRRVGIRPEGRAVAREGAIIRDEAGAEIGRLTSGGFGPTIGGPVAMGYVASGHAAPGTALQVEVRGKAVPARVTPLPFVPHRYHRKS